MTIQPTGPAWEVRSRPRPHAFLEMRDGTPTSRKMMVETLSVAQSALSHPQYADAGRTMEHVGICGSNGVCQHLVAYVAAVDEKILIVARAAIEARRGDQAMQSQPGRAVVERERGGCEFFAE